MVKPFLYAPAYFIRDPPYKTKRGHEKRLYCPRLPEVPDAVWGWLVARKWLVSVNDSCKGGGCDRWAEICAKHPALRVLISHLGLPAAPPKGARSPHPPRHSNCAVGPPYARLTSSAAEGGPRCGKARSAGRWRTTGARSLPCCSSRGTRACASSSPASTRSPRPGTRSSPGRHWHFDRK